MGEKNVVIIGAGASGLMAAVTAARNGALVTVLEHMESAGKKLLLTGSGKCNFTNRLLLRGSGRIKEHYHGDPDLAASVIERFDAEDCIRFFRELGVESVNRSYPYDDGIYVYPASMESRSILRALLSECERLSVSFVYNCHISSVNESSDGRWGIHTDLGTFDADSLIFAVGSNAAPRTGSDSSIYPVIKSLGHGFMPFLPALCGLRPEAGALDELKGVRAEAIVGLHVYSDNDMMLYQSRGEVQLSSEGISGVCVMDLSGHASLSLKRGYDTVLSLRFLPWLSDEELKAYVIRQYESHPEGPLDLLSGALPLRLSEYIMRRSGSMEQTADLIRDLRFRIKKTADFEHSQAASGGIPTHEIDSSTMGSKLKRSIFFCGELVDVYGNCGGYNLQYAWSSGYVAGMAAAVMT